MISKHEAWQLIHVLVYDVLRRFKLLSPEDINAGVAMTIKGSVLRLTGTLINNLHRSIFLARLEWSTR